MPGDEAVLKRTQTVKNNFGLGLHDTLMGDPAKCELNHREMHTLKNEFLSLAWERHVEKCMTSAESHTALERAADGANAPWHPILLALLRPAGRHRIRALRDVLHTGMEGEPGSGGGSVHIALRPPNHHRLTYVRALVHTSDPTVSTEEA